jgi:hypothetical protein
MAVEIGTLVVRGAFGAPARDAAASVDAETLERWRRDILDEVRDLMAEAERRARER